MSWADELGRGGVSSSDQSQAGRPPMARRRQRSLLLVAVVQFLSLCVAEWHLHLVEAYKKA